MKQQENFDKNFSLTASDVQKLVSNPSSDVRINITGKLARHYSQGNFSPQQKELAEQIFRLLVRDTEVKVRKVLSHTIKNSYDIPKDIVLNLAKDIEDVSIPVLQFSEVLDDNDLVQIIKSSEEEAKHLAVTKRDKVSEAISGALVDSGTEKVVKSLLTNKNAKVAEESYSKIVDYYSNKEEIVGSMIERGALPISVVEALTKKISSEMEKQLIQKHGEAFERFKQSAGDNYEVMAMKVIGAKASEKEIVEFYKKMEKMQVPKQLMPIYALCMGNINLFTVSMARITNVPIINVRHLVQDNTNKGLFALYTKANLPGHFYEATELLVEVLREIMRDADGKNIIVSKEFYHRIMESLMLKSEEKGKAVENIDYILELIKMQMQNNLDSMLFK